MPNLSLGTGDCCSLSEKKLGGQVAGGPAKMTGDTQHGLFLGDQVLAPKQRFQPGGNVNHVTIFDRLNLLRD
jgi:hypothetical protein